MRVWRYAWVLLVFPAIAQAWWNDDWSYRKQLSVDSVAAQLSGGVSEAPVLVRLHTGNFSYFHDLKPDGADLRFIANDLFHLLLKLFGSYYLSGGFPQP